MTGIMNPRVNLSARTPKISRTMTKLFAVQALYGAYTPTTFSWASGDFLNSTQIFDAEGEFDEVALIFGNSDPTSTLSVQAAVSAGGTGGTCTLTDLTNNSGTYTAVTFGGAASGTVPVSPVAMPGGPNNHFPGLLISDWIPLTSLPRSDVSGGRPLLYVRSAAVPQSATQSLCLLEPVPTRAAGYAQTQTAPLASWERVALSTTANGTSANLGGTAAGTPGFGGGYAGACIGFMYRLRAGRGMTVLCVGDSITEGAGTTGQFGWSAKLGFQLNINNAGGNAQAMSSMPVETISWGFSGQTTATYSTAFDLLLAAGIAPNVAIFSPYSPNTRNSAVSRQSFIDFIARCENASIYPLAWTGVPSPTLLYNGYDADRLTYNTELLAGMDVGMMDFNGAVSGATAASSAVISGTISGNTLTVVSVTSGTVAANQEVTGTSVTQGTFIVSGSGTTWTLNNASTVSTAETLTCTGGVQQYASGMAYTDNTHPNDTGDNALLGVAVNKLQPIISNYFAGVTT